MVCGVDTARAGSVEVAGRGLTRETGRRQHCALNSAKQRKNTEHSDTRSSPTPS